MFSISKSRVLKFIYCIEVTTKKREAKEEKEKKEEVPVQKAPPKEPPPFEFMTEMPAISAQDL